MISLSSQGVYFVRFLFLFFIAVPLVEMLLLFEVSDQIGGLSTLGLVVATAVIGVQVLKQQGIATLTRANARLSSGELPAQEIIEGMLLAAAGALLLTPGFITDTLGFVFLAGPLRRLIAARLLRSGLVRAGGGLGAGFSGGPVGGASGGFSRRSQGGFSGEHQGFDTSAAGSAEGETIEGEIVREVDSATLDKGVSETDEKARSSHFSSEENK
ncbi:MAG: FxsA family protein [OM182 bacterium]